MDVGLNHLSDSGDTFDHNITAATFASGRPAA